MQDECAIASLPFKAGIGSMLKVDPSRCVRLDQLNGIGDRIGRMNLG